MKLTILGNASRYLAPLSGGSSYLVEEGGTKILLDAGGGARAALAELGVDRLDAVVLSHFHYDHVLDFVTMLDAIDAGTAIVIPSGERKRFDSLAQAYVFRGEFTFAGPLVEAAVDAPLDIGGLRLSFAPTQHSALAFATRIDGAAQSSLVYASDTAPCDALRTLARGAGLLLMHTLLPMVEKDAEHARIHTTAQMAGALAAEVGAKRLLLSHRFHGSTDPAMREAAGARFAGVELASDGGTYSIP